MDRGTREPAEILAAGAPSARAALRDRQARHAISIDVDAGTLDRTERHLDACREAIGVFFALKLTRREGAGFLRYEPGGFYRPHRDRADVASWPGAAQRRIAIVAFLNDEFSGGTLRLLEEEPSDLVPRTGSLVAFPATALHEVIPVSAGTRDVIVDWFY